MTVAQHEQSRAEAAPAGPAKPYGLIAEFDNVDSVIAAARAARQAGFTRIDVHSPFAIHGIEKIIGVRPTILPWVVLLGGLTGLFGALALTIGTMAYHYPFMISGKPFNSLPAFIPVIFECTILFGGITATVFMLLFNKLPMLYHPLLRNERFRRFSDDRFFLVVEARDRRFDKDRTRRFLEGRNPLAVELVEQ